MCPHGESNLQLFGCGLALQLSHAGWGTKNILMVPDGRGVGKMGKMGVRIKMGKFPVIKTVSGPDWCGSVD